MVFGSFKGVYKSFTDDMHRVTYRNSALRAALVALVFSAAISSDFCMGDTALSAPPNHVAASKATQSSPGLEH